MTARVLDDPPTLHELLVVIAPLGLLDEFADHR